MGAAGARFVFGIIAAMEFDFAAVTSPFRMQPGLRRLAEGARQLTPNRIGSRALHEKLAVLDAFAGQALLAAPGFDAAPALDALCAQAALEHPAEFGWDGAGQHKAYELGWSLAGEAVQGSGPAEIGATLCALRPEWRRAALLSLAFAEDFAVIDGASARVPWLAVCLPSHWAPEQKVGRHFAEVHAPVADNALLVSASGPLARLVTGQDRWERFVWTITRHAQMHAHPARCDPAPWPEDVDAAALAAEAFFRTERQTFIPLPRHRQAVFTILVELLPLAEAIDSPGRAAQVHDALASMSDAVLAYRGLHGARDRLLAWLAQRAAT
jgi:dimethylamine monooxygenase subunit A